MAKRAARLEEQAEFIRASMPDMDLVRAEKARRSLHFYLREMWKHLEPDTPFKDNWHIGAKCEHLQAVSMGQIRKLLINEPPRCLKSITVGVAWPSWEWVDHPWIKWLFTSYAQTLTTRDSVKCRQVIDSPWYQSRWGHVYQLTDDQNAKNRYENTRHGIRIASSIEGLGTGEGGNRVVIDDAHNMKEIHSNTIREEVVRVWKESLSTRRNDPKKDAFVMVMQRGHEADLSGYVLAEEEGWTHLCLPMEYEPKRFVFVKGMRKEVEVKTLVTPIGFRDPRTKKGELLQPDRFGPAEVSSLKKSLGSYGASGQLQQQPSPAEGGIFKRANWKFYKVLPNLDEVTISVDCSFKDFASSDYVSIQVWGRLGANHYLLHKVTEQLGFGATCNAIRTVRGKFPEAIAVLIEDKANGPAVIDTIKGEISGVLPITPEGGKTARAFACQPTHESGNVFLPDPLSEKGAFVEDFIELWGAFPNVVHDDDVDAGTQYLNWARNRAEHMGLFQYMQEESQRVEKEREEERKKHGRTVIQM